ncbi:hypothetical protein PS910_01780 [Pseudomonas fluorescens]|nr:hypothetical protein PS910_01780 [Pseudomonas fluorescens]
MHLHALAQADPSTGRHDYPVVTVSFPATDVQRTVLDTAAGGEGQAQAVEPHLLGNGLIADDGQPPRMPFFPQQLLLSHQQDAPACPPILLQRLHHYHPVLQYRMAARNAQGLGEVLGGCSLL